MTLIFAAELVEEFSEPDGASLAADFDLKENSLLLRKLIYKHIVRTASLQGAFRTRLFEPCAFRVRFFTSITEINVFFSGYRKYVFLCLFEFVRYLGYKIYALTKCSNRFDCLIEDMVLIRKP